MTSALAYEPGTHRDMSDLAAQNSVLAKAPKEMPTTVLQDWGLSGYADQTLPEGMRVKS
jgi:hypothetical protein